MKYYKVMTDFKSFISIDETELEKALKAWAVGGKALFKEGATNRIEVIIPDYHRIMGWNYGYELRAEDYADISASKECSEAKRLLSDTTLRLRGTPERPKEISDEVKKLARKMTEPTWDR